MKKNKKKYPVFSYLVYLLAVTVLFTGVSFSRYSISSSGAPSASVAGFNCSFSIDNLSSFSFSNINYFLGGEEFGTPIELDFSLSNYRTEGGITYQSGVDAQASVTLKLPAEFADNLALQIENIGQETAYTPQIVLGQLIYGYSQSADNDGNPVITLGTEYHTHNGETFKFYTYGAIENNYQESVTATGTLADGGTLTAEWDEGKAKIEITTLSEPVDYVDYSVSFERDGGAAEDIYLDLSKNQTYYLIKITTPDMLLSSASEGQVKENFKAYLTLTSRINASAGWYSSLSADQNGNAQQDGRSVTPVFKSAADGSYTVVGDMMELITSPPKTGENYVILSDYDYENNSFVAAQDAEVVTTITGYHFGQEANYINGDGSTGESTLVRVNCAYTYEGTYNITLDHVAPIAQGHDDYVHSMVWGDNVTMLTGVSAPTAQNNNTPFANIPSANCTNVSGPRKISVANLNIYPVNSSITSAVNISYNWNMQAYFVQASQTDKGT